MNLLEVERRSLLRGLDSLLNVFIKRNQFEGLDSWHSVFRMHNEMRKILLPPIIQSHELLLQVTIT